MRAGELATERFVATLRDLDDLARSDFKSCSILPIVDLAAPASVGSSDGMPSMTRWSAERSVSSAFLSDCSISGGSCDCRRLVQGRFVAGPERIEWNLVLVEKTRRAAVDDRRRARAGKMSGIGIAKCSIHTRAAVRGRRARLVRHITDGREQRVLRLSGRSSTFGLNRSGLVCASLISDAESTVVSPIRKPSPSRRIGCLVPLR